MGKLIILCSSVLTCLVGFYLAFSHDISDFCITQIKQYNCETWDFKVLAIYAITYLLLGVVIGVTIKFVVSRLLLLRN